jgi:uncharacterized protein
MQLFADGFDGLRPEIEYPCRWEYKTIGRSEELMRRAVVQIMAVEELQYSVELSNSSRSGKYCSLVVGVTVGSEDHRNRIFAALSAHGDIMIVM